MKDNFFCWLANHMPRRMAYWCAIRVIAHASTVHPTREVDTLTPAMCLKAWPK